MTGKSIPLLFVTGMALLMAAASVPAVAGVPSITQLTDDNYTPPPVEEGEPLPPPPEGAKFPDISANGSTVVFTSDSDLIPGQNPNRVRNLFVMNSDGSGLRQLTHATSGGSTHARVSADGSVVVFQSSSDLTGDNPPEQIQYDSYDENSQLVTITENSYQPQIFIMNTDGTGLRQLTHGVGGNALNPAISGDGTLVVFESDRDPLGENGDLTMEVFAASADGTWLRQLTVGTPKPQGVEHIRDDESRNAVISLDGKTVAFDSFQDLVPPRNDDRSDEVFVFDLAGYLADNGNRADYTVQVTDVDIDPTTGHIPQEESFQPSISADGSWIAFSACINPWGDPIDSANRTVLGTNATLADVIFVVKRDGTGLKQLTFSDDKYDDAQWPSISADGSVIIFSSDSLLADGIDTRGYQQIFAIRSDGTGLTQLTKNDKEQGYIKARISSDGNTAYFYTATDVTGGNADNTSEIFAARFELPVAVIAQNPPSDPPSAEPEPDPESTPPVAEQTPTNESTTTTSQTTGGTTGTSSVATTIDSSPVKTGALGLIEALLFLAGLAGAGAVRRRAA